MDEMESPDFQLEVSDPEALAEAIRGSHIEACLLAGSRGQSHLERVHLPHSCFDSAALSAPMLMSGQMAADCHTLIYVTECPSSGHSFNFGIKHGSGYMGFFAPGGTLDAMTPTGYANASLTVPVEWFQREITHRFPDIPGEWLRRGYGFRVQDNDRGKIAELLGAREEMMRLDPDTMMLPAARLGFERSLLEAFVDALRSRHAGQEKMPSIAISRRYGVLRRIRDHVAANHSTPVRLDELCVASGMSRRGLEYLLKDHFGLGVNAFIRCQRLHGARREILASEPVPGFIKRIALNWGFWHLGRFASQFRELFGENPSETFRRAHRSA
jgi:AraC-like DNA-binding protein